MTARRPWQMPAFLAPAIDMHAHPPMDKSQTESMLSAARHVGIERIIFSCLGCEDMPPYPQPEVIRCANQVVFDLTAEHPGFVYGLAYVNPNHPQTMDVLEDAFRRPGILGIKLWISCRDDRGRLDPVYPVLEYAAERNVPILCHTFSRTGGNMPGELSPADLIHLATRYPHTRLVMAHLGGQWIQGVRAVAPYPNVWADISGSRAYMGSVEFAVQHLGAGRVLFGSDAFIRNFAVMLAKVAAAEIETGDKRRIVWDNSQALFFGGSISNDY